MAVTGSDLEWFGRVERRAERLWGDERVGDDLKRLSYALHEQDPDYRPPTGFRPDLIRRLDRPIRRLAVGQQGEMLEFVRGNATERESSCGLHQPQQLDPGQCSTLPFGNPASRQAGRTTGARTTRPLGHFQRRKQARRKNHPADALDRARRLPDGLAGGRAGTLQTMKAPSIP